MSCFEKLAFRAPAWAGRVGVESRSLRLDRCGRLQGKRWMGGLNLLLYPFSPIIYGFWIRKDLGRRSAIAATLSFSILVLAVVFAIW